jgi:hypothetical protein
VGRTRSGRTLSRRAAASPEIGGKGSDEFCSFHRSFSNRDSTTKKAVALTEHKVGTREEWLAARRGLLEREKELTRLNDELACERRELPWVPVEKEYPRRAP